MSGQRTYLAGHGGKESRRVNKCWEQRQAPDVEKHPWRQREGQE